MLSLDFQEETIAPKSDLGGLQKRDPGLCTHCAILNMAFRRLHPIEKRVDSLSKTDPNPKLRHY